MKARHYRVAMIGAAIASILGTMAGNINLPIPFLSSLIGPSTMPAPVVPSVILVVLTGAMLQSAELYWTDASVRNVVAHSMLLAAGLVVLVCVVSHLTGIVVHDNAAAWLMVRDVLGLLVLWSSARALGINRFAGLVPVVYLLIASAFARNSIGEVRGWAWILGRNLSDPWALATIGSGCLLTLLYVLRRRPLVGTTARSSS